MSARWAGNPSLVLLLGSHTIKAHPCIFPLFFGGVFLVAPVKIGFKWMHAEIIPKLLDVAPLQGPLPMKIIVVRFCTVPLEAPSQKNNCFDPSDH
jgi:hypothetical protein